MAHYQWRPEVCWLSRPSAQTAHTTRLSVSYLMWASSRERAKRQSRCGVYGARLSASIHRGLALRRTQPKIDSEEFSIETFHGGLPGSAQWTISKTADLRYGENPHQIAALYKTAMQRGIANAEFLSGKEMSFNNYVDADAAWQLVCDFEETACAIIKHTNPAGVGLSDNAEDAYRKALATDPVSAFGGSSLSIVQSMNRCTRGDRDIH